MFTKILLEGFKSFRDRTEVELRPLTILAGANSSGKSSLIQPLLLLKQTLLSEADPGPLRLDGPNVIFNQKEQMFWSMPGEKRTRRLRIGVWSAPGKAAEVNGVQVAFRNPGPDSPLHIEECVWYRHNESLVLRKGDTPSEIRSRIEKSNLFLRMIGFLFRYDDFVPEVTREGPFLDLRFKPKGEYRGGSATLACLDRMPVTSQLRQLIHVPGNRGNPQRSYPVRSVGKRFPGPFQEYVASLIEEWERKRPGKNGKPRSEEKLRLLTDWLKLLGLTWKIETRRWNDIEVEIRVARTARSRRGWGRDVVSIADAGFGISQSLPVVVALLAADDDQTVYIEQPEIHLHPDAQVGMATVFARALRRRTQVIPETHSSLLLLGIQKEIAEGNLDPKDVVLHWFERDKDGASQVHTTGFNRDGSYENPEIPIDFAQVSMKLMQKFLSAAVAAEPSS